jgi:hypothetical protein
VSASPVGRSEVDRREVRRPGTETAAKAHREAGSAATPKPEIDADRDP